MAYHRKPAEEIRKWIAQCEEECEERRKDYRLMEDSFLDNVDIDVLMREAATIDVEEEYAPHTGNVGVPIPLVTIVKIEPEEDRE